MYNIYCDESCHLENDDSDIMVLGGISCHQSLKQKVFNDIRKIKIKHGLSSWFEVKWTKVSDSKIDFYLDLIYYFFENEGLFFRGVVATHKKSLDHDKYNSGDYDLWYYKMYFLLLDPMIEPFGEHRIFIDIKDTKGGPKVRKLRQVLCNNMYDFKQEFITEIVQIDSKESEIIQLTDLFIGALSYYHRKKHLDKKANKGKIKIIDILTKQYSINLSEKTDRYEKKFNIFIWNPKGA